MPSGGLHNPYHLLWEPETIEIYSISSRSPSLGVSSNLFVSYFRSTSTISSASVKMCSQKKSIFGLYTWPKTCTVNIYIHYIDYKSFFLKHLTDHLYSALTAIMNHSLDLHCHLLRFGIWTPKTYHPNTLSGDIWMSRYCAQPYGFTPHPRPNNATKASLKIHEHCHRQSKDTSEV